MDKPKHGGRRSDQSLNLRRRVARMLSSGWTPEAIRHEIVTDGECTATEKFELLKELHMEWSEQS